MGKVYECGVSTKDCRRVLADGKETEVAYYLSGARCLCVGILGRSRFAEHVRINIVSDADAAGHL